jgi:hypothetical protein
MADRRQPFRPESLWRGSRPRRDQTLNSECFAIGTLASANSIPGDIALSWLLTATHDMPDYDHPRRWRAREIVRKVEHAFADGLRRSREVRHG